MIEILELARDVARFSEVRRISRGVRYARTFGVIDKIASGDVKAIENPDKQVVQLACVISNMEPSIYIANGESMHMGQLRIRSLENDEIRFVQDKLWEYFKGMKLAAKPLFNKAVKHLLTGCAATKNPEVSMDIARASVLIADPEDSVAQLIGYAIAFRCRSVAELADLFTFHYVDVTEQAKEQGILVYTFNGQVHEKLVR